MAKILFVYDNDEPPVQITKRFFEQFKMLHNCCVEFVRTPHIDSETLNSCDVLVEIRPQSIYLARIAKIVKKSGRLVAAIYDDDFLALPNFHKRRRIQEKAITDVLRTIDVLICTNDSLMEKYAGIGQIKRCVRTDTAVGDEEINFVTSVSECENKNNRILYYCNDGSTETFEKTIGVFIPSIIEKYGDIFEWTIIGAQPTINACVDKKNIKYISHLTLEEFRSELRSGRYIIGIAPLTEDEFSGHKYINKYMEYTTAGIPCIFSKVSPYKDFINDGKDGILANNTEYEWVQAFGVMMNVNNRYRIIKNAQMRIMEEFSVAGISKRIVDSIPEMDGQYCNKKKLQIKSIQLQAANMEKAFCKLLDPIHRAWGRLQVEGLNSLVYYSLSRIKKR